MYAHFNYIICFSRTNCIRCIMPFYYNKMYTITFEITFLYYITKNIININFSVEIILFSLLIINYSRYNILFN